MKIAASTLSKHNLRLLYDSHYLHAYTRAVAGWYLQGLLCFLVNYKSKSIWNFSFLYAGHFGVHIPQDQKFKNHVSKSYTLGKLKLPLGLTCNYELQSSQYPPYYEMAQCCSSDISLPLIS